MPTMLEYELWDGKKVVGVYRCNVQLMGKYLVTYEPTLFKQPHGQQFKTIKVPLMLRQIDYKTYVLCLDVRKKSKRQIAMIKS